MTFSAYYLLMLSGSVRTYVKIASNVSRLTKGTIIKRGQATALRLEAEATRCVALHTYIPVPTVYDFWTKDGGHACLVMGYKDGDTVQRNWRHLSVDQKMAVMRVLRAFHDELHHLCQPHPKRTIGLVSGEVFFYFRISG